MQWFLALNEGGPAFKQYADMARVAIHTALARTSLRPHLLYDGQENDFTHWVRQRNVPVIACRTSLFAELTDLARRRNEPGFAAALPGIFLRVELPALRERLGLDARVLYTDCDVLFQREVVDILEPIGCKYFAVAAESDRALPQEMNTGVMWMHLPEMFRLDEQFREYLRENIDALPAMAWDQGAYRSFYRSPDHVPLWENLPPEMNWKPYWEDYSNARIIHFHGPKPFQRNYIDTHYQELKHLSGGCYAELCEIWEGLLKEAR